MNKMYSSTYFLNFGPLTKLLQKLYSFEILIDKRLNTDLIWAKMVQKAKSFEER